MMNGELPWTYTVRTGPSRYATRHCSTTTASHATSTRSASARSSTSPASTSSSTSNQLLHEPRPRPDPDPARVLQPAAGRPEAALAASRSPRPARRSRSTHPAPATRTGRSSGTNGTSTATALRARHGLEPGDEEGLRGAGHGDRHGPGVRRRRQGHRRHRAPAGEPRRVGRAPRAGSTRCGPGRRDRACVRAQGVRGTARGAVLRVSVPAAGTLRLRPAAGRRAVRRIRTTTAKRGIVSVRVIPSRAGRACCAHGRLRLRVVLSFTPVGGATQMFKPYGGAKLNGRAQWMRIRSELDLQAISRVLWSAGRGPSRFAWRSRALTIACAAAALAMAAPAAHAYTFGSPPSARSARRRPRSTGAPTSATTTTSRISRRVRTATRPARSS